MFTEDELELNFFDMNGISEEMKERIMKVATKPQSIRLSKFDIAHYLLELQDKRGLASISEAVRYCVLYTKKNMPIDAADDGIEVPQDESSEYVDMGTVPPSIKVPVVPKSVNVDWSNLPPLERDPITNPTSADEIDEF
jgi:hypothetical protein